MKEKPKICFISLSIYPVLTQGGRLDAIGGAEIQQAFIIRELDRRGYDVYVITRDFGQPDRVVIGRNITVVKTCKNQAGLPVLRQIHPKSTTLWQRMKEIDADIYYQRTASFNTGLIARFCKLHNKQFIFSVAHDLDVELGNVSRNSKAGNPIREMRDRLSYHYGLRAAHQIVVQNQTQKKRLRVNFQRDAIQILSTYKPTYESTTPKRNIILWVARLVSWKRPELFIELATRFPQFNFVLAGGTTDTEYYNSLVEKVKDSNCQLAGFVPYQQVEQLFDRAMLFINTSESEGFPNTFLQAWARGIPTLSTVNPSQVISTHGLGYSCAGLADFERQLRQLLENKENYQQISQRCRTYFSNQHAIDFIGDQYETLFKSML